MLELGPVLVCVSVVDCTGYNSVCEVAMSISVGTHGLGWCTVDVWIRPHMGSECGHSTVEGCLVP
jgi:hypothetical protein